MSSARSASPTPCPEPSWPPAKESSSNRDEPRSSSPLAPGRTLTCLPLSRLRRDARPLLESFSRLGLRTLADLAALPRKDVTARFGPLGNRLHHLAAGTHHEVPAIPRPAQDITVTSDLDPPVERADTAAFAARHLAENLAARLLSAGLSVGRLCVAARCEDGTDLARSWMLEDTPTPAELTDRVRWQLEGWLSGRSGRPPSSGLTHLSLTALELSPATTSQTGLWQAPGHQAQSRARRAAERVESLLGAGSIQVPRIVPGRDPRSRVLLIPWGESEGVGSPRVMRQRPGAALCPSPHPPLSCPDRFLRVSPTLRGESSASTSMVSSTVSPASSVSTTAWLALMRVLWGLGPRWRLCSCGPDPGRSTRGGGPPRGRRDAPTSRWSPMSGRPACWCDQAGGGSMPSTPEELSDDAVARGGVGRRRPFSHRSASVTRHSQASPRDQPARTSVIQW